MTNYVVCLKWGTKYSAEYVNRLYNMVERNLTLPYKFVCFTDDPTDINPNVRIASLPWNTSVKGWWYKPYFFNPQFKFKGTVLFLDLDLVIFDNIDRLFTYSPGKFCIIRDFNRHLIKDYKKFNSSVFRLDIGQHKAVYEKFIENPQAITQRYQGDQDWIRNCIVDNFEYWPDEWIQSYKWEMRGKPMLDQEPKGERDFLIPGEPIIKPETSIAVFHGDPNPHNCKDPWVIDNWR